MATLPADRTKLALAQANQVPSAVASAKRNIDTLTEAYDTIDLLNQKVDDHISATPLPHADGSVTTAKLANGAVTTGKIADSAITADKVADGVLTKDKFVPEALTNETQNGLRITNLENEKDSRYINVKYPPPPLSAATGDGVTDDTNAILSCQSALSNLGGGIIFFPKGTYIFDGRLTLTSDNIIIEGVGNSSVLKCKDSTFSPDHLIAATSKKNIVIRNMKFEGNEALPSGDPGTAVAGFFFQSCENVLVEYVEMTKFMGVGIGFSGCINGKVDKSYFHDMGQDQIGLSPMNAVPAVWSGNTSQDIKVTNSRFYDCRFSGVFHFADGGEISGNTFDHIGESAIYTEYSSTHTTKNVIISNNRINDCYIVDISATGIECAANQSTILGNIISNCEGNGIGIGSSSNVTVEGNICFNNNQNPGVTGLDAAGIYLILDSASANPDKGRNIVVKGNICYDDQSVATQKYGIKVAGDSGSSYLGTIIEGNACYRNTVADLSIDPIPFADKSNIVRNNTPWPDVYRDIGRYTHNDVGDAYPKLYSIPAGSMLINGGIRVKAWGTVSGTTGTKTIRVQHTGASGLATVSFEAAETGQWEIDAEIFNVGAVDSQVRIRRGFANAGTVDYGTDTASIDTSVNQDVFVRLTLDDANDTITCDGLIVERI